MINLPKTMATENRGASVTQVTSRDQMRAWYMHHKASAASSLRQLWAAPLQSLMIWLVIAIALALPAALLMAVDNVKMLGERWWSDPKITIYLQLSTPESARVKVGELLRKLPGVVSLEYISPQQGLEELKHYGGFGDALSALGENPLPPVYLLTLADTREQTLQIVDEQASAFPEVEKVQIDMQWVQRLHHIVVLAERVAGVLGVFLSLGVLLTIGNITRLLMERRRDEVAVIKLVGGTDAFVRRPLLYTGMWYGLVGGGMAWLLLAGASAWLAPVAQELLASYGSSFPLRRPGFAAFAQLLLTGGFLGLLGAWLTAAHYLRAVRPQ